MKDRERIQPNAGRLGLLLQDPETLKRYEVEIQLGSTDESHIIRTIEYWDIERKRYPQYEAFTPIYQMEDLSRYWVPNVTTPILAGPAFGYIGHWYAVGGAVALVFAGLFTGGLFRAVRTILNRPEKREGDLVLYMLVIVPIGFGEAASTPLFWILTLPPMLMPLLVLVYLARRRDGKLRHAQRTRRLV